jgi:hypothetical protein
MKRYTRLFSLMAAICFLLVACSPEKVAPVGGDRNSGPNLAGALDAHPDLELICNGIDTIELVSEDGSHWCNKCYDMFGSPRPCDGFDSLVTWGDVVMMNGLDSIDTDNDSMYDDAENIFVANITMAAGWFIVTSQSQFATNNNWVVNNGIIQIQNDWLSSNVNPVENAWQLRRRVEDLPACFDVAIHLSVVSLDLFSQEIIGSETSIWGWNPHHDDPDFHSYSPYSPYLTHFCPDPCGRTACPVDSVCTVVYRNLTCNSGSTVLTPTVDGIGPFSYEWSTGARTSSITVNPVVNTPYSVTVTSMNTCMNTTYFDVKAIDVACSIPALTRVEFCPVNLNLRYNQTFNIRNYVRHVNGNAVYPSDWSRIVFTYTSMGANAPTNPGEWHLADFMAGQNVTVTAADAAAGKGNVATGQYRIYIGRLGQPTYDDYMTIRVNNSQPSNLTSVCGYGPSCAPSGGGVPTPGVKICYVPPGNPSGATTICVAAANVGNYITDYCTNQNMTAQPGYSLGQCGSNTCAQVGNRVGFGGGNKSATSAARGRSNF